MVIDVADMQAQQTWSAHFSKTTHAVAGTPCKLLSESRGRDILAVADESPGTTIRMTQLTEGAIAALQSPNLATHLAELFHRYTERASANGGSSFC